MNDDYGPNAKSVESRANHYLIIDAAIATDYASKKLAVLSDLYRDAQDSLERAQARLLKVALEK